VAAAKSLSQALLRGLFLTVISTATKAAWATTTFAGNETGPFSEVSRINDRLPHHWRVGHNHGCARRDFIDCRLGCWRLECTPSATKTDYASQDVEASAEDKEPD